MSSERNAPEVATLSPPLKWHGGKHYLAPRILALMPPHLHYVEPFFGGGQVLFARDPADRRLWWPGETSDGRKADGVSELVNDIDGNLMNFYAALKEPATFDRLRQHLEQTLFSEAEWEAADALLASGGGDPVQRAVALFVQVRQSRSAMRKDFASTVRTRLRGGRNDGVNAWWNAVAGLADVHHRLADVLVLNRPALEVVRSEDTPATFFYLDPPYVPGTRTAPNVYAHEMTTVQHVELLTLLGGIQGKFLLSGYPSELYDGFARAHDWNRHVVDVPNNAAGGVKKERKTEVLWCNF